MIQVSLTSMASSKIQLTPEQEQAVTKLKTGSILYGGVGSGKTYTSLVYYKEVHSDVPLYVITTAKVRDSHSWEESAANLGIKSITVDSWNNIEKYVTKNGFFIFDEQKTLTYGKWSRTLIKIARSGKPWIMLSATPGDTWLDYMVVFIANGFYRNPTQFKEQHIVYNPYVKFPQIKEYINEGILMRHRRDILVPLVVKRHTRRHFESIYTDFNIALYSKVMTNRFNYLKNRPIKNASELTQLVRRIISSSPGRIRALKEQMAKYPKMIVFYNYDYEKDIIIKAAEQGGYNVAQYNGKVHDDLPESETWIYAVQYTAAEGWNATSTNHIVFYSPNYSWKVTEQAQGRIDRLNTKFTDLYYTFLVSHSSIDEAVLKSVAQKKKFNESYWGKQYL